jgi:single-strand DNA-binding protein
MNLAVLKGRLTRDPELRQTQTGKTVVSFTVACDNGKNRNGERFPADFINCTAWDSTAEAIGRYFTKGKEILVAGSIKVSKWDEGGQVRYKTYVQVRTFEFCGSREGGTGKQDERMQEFEDLVLMDDDGELPF